MTNGRWFHSDLGFPVVAQIVPQTRTATQGGERGWFVVPCKLTCCSISAVHIRRRPLRPGCEACVMLGVVCPAEPGGRECQVCCSNTTDDCPGVCNLPKRAERGSLVYATLNKKASSRCSCTTMTARSPRAQLCTCPDQTPQTEPMSPQVGASLTKSPVASLSLFPHRDLH